VAPSLGLHKKFYVKRIKIEGNTLVRTRTLDKAVASYEGKESDLAELEKAAEAVTKVYADHGYGFARAFIPPQTLKNGVVVIYVVEGKIGKIRVVGNKFYRTAFIR
jgi:hemolysin activation/secretion protein